MKKNIIPSLITMFFCVRFVQFLIGIGFTPNAFPYDYYTNGLLDVFFVIVLFLSSILHLFYPKFGILLGMLALVLLFELCFQFCAIEIDWLVNPDKIHPYRKLSRPDFLLWIFIFSFYIIKTITVVKQMIKTKLL